MFAQQIMSFSVSDDMSINVTKFDVHAVLCELMII